MAETQPVGKRTIAYGRVLREGNFTARSKTPAVSQNRFSRARIRQGDVFERLDSPRVSLPRQHGKDQRVDDVRASRMSRTDRESAPEVHDRRIVVDRGHVDQFVLQRGIAVDRCMDGRMQLDNRRDAAHVVAKPVHERGVFMEQRSEGLHVVAVPGGLKCVKRVFGLPYLNHVDSHNCLCWAADVGIQRLLSCGQSKFASSALSRNVG